jgi:hypothetical protein
MALGLLLLSGMKIEVRLEEPADPVAGSDGALRAVEVLEGGDEFLDALTMRLNEIVRKPSGRFVISYVPGKPGSKVPPRIQ